MRRFLLLLALTPLLALAQDSRFSERSGGLAAGQSTAQGAAANLGVAYTLCQSAVAVSTAADTVENVQYTCTIPANSLGANGRFYFRAYWTFTNNANAKTMRVRYSGAAGTVLLSQGLSSNVGALTEGYVANRNATNSQHASLFGVNNAGSGSSASATTAVDTTASSSVVFSCQKATGSDTCTLESVYVAVMYGL